AQVRLARLEAGRRELLRDARADLGQRPGGENDDRPAFAVVHVHAETALNLTLDEGNLGREVGGNTAREAVEEAAGSLVDEPLNATLTALTGERVERVPEASRERQRGPQREGGERSGGAARAPARAKGQHG